MCGKISNIARLLLPWHGANKGRLSQTALVGVQGTMCDVAVNAREGGGHGVRILSPAAVVT